MRKLRTLVLLLSLFFVKNSYGQIDLNKLDLRDLIGKVVHVEKGFAPKFYLGKTPIEQINKVAEILGLKKNEEVNLPHILFYNFHLYFKST